MLRNLDYYRDQRAPHYGDTVDFLRQTLSTQSQKLSEALSHFLKETSAYIGLEKSFEIFSEMHLDIGPVNHPGEWALRISESLNATTYINPPGGRLIYDHKQFQEAGIELLFLTATLPTYDQRRADFLPGLSIIDALMWNTRDRVAALIRTYSLDP